MKLDRDKLTLAFDDLAELGAFHDQLGTLIREITLKASASTPDPELATARTREVLSGLSTVMAALNAVRTSGLIERRGE